jgi:hypothetical protein
MHGDIRILGFRTSSVSRGAEYMERCVRILPAVISVYHYHGYPKKGGDGSGSSEDHLNWSSKATIACENKPTMTREEDYYRVYNSRVSESSE